MSDRQTLEQLLSWYVATGADEAMGDQPIDRFAEETRRWPNAQHHARPPPQRWMPPAPSPRRRASLPAPMPASPAGDAVTAARAAAAAAQTVEELRDAVLAFDGCSLKKTATNTVFADGNPDSRLMFIGEAPGADEDRIGRPFVGVSGQLLDRMLGTIGLDRTQAYITNILFWRPPGNRKPSESEIATCLPFVERHIALVRPKLLVLVGGTASAALFPGSEGITRLRGRWLRLNVNGCAEPVQTIAMYHPSFLLRSPERKRESWLDLLSIKSKLTDPAG